MTAVKAAGLVLAAGLAAIGASAVVTSCTGAPSTTTTTTSTATSRPHPTPSASPSPSTLPGSIPVGPGAQKVYTVQPQLPIASCHYRAEGTYPLPDATCTPGATNPGVTQANVGTTICVRGWTATIRPPQAVTGPEKAANGKSYGGGQNPRTVEYDHLIPLELGGDPNDPRNLWVEPNDNPAAASFGNAKDPVENAARQAVCAGTLPLAQAQAQIAGDWPALGRRLGVLR